MSRDLEGAGRSAAVKSAADEETKARRMPASQERAVEAKARALAVQEQGSGPSFGMRRPSLFEAPAERPRLPRLPLTLKEYPTDSRWRTRSSR